MVRKSKKATAQKHVVTKTVPTTKQITDQKIDTDKAIFKLLSKKDPEELQKFLGRFKMTTEPSPPSPIEKTDLMDVDEVTDSSYPIPLYAKRANITKVPVNVGKLTLATASDPLKYLEYAFALESQFESVCSFMSLADAKITTEEVENRYKSDPEKREIFGLLNSHVKLILDSDIRNRFANLDGRQVYQKVMMEGRGTKSKVTALAMTVFLGFRERLGKQGANTVRVSSVINFYFQQISKLYDSEDSSSLLAFWAKEVQKTFIGLGALFHSTINNEYKTVGALLDKVATPSVESYRVCFKPYSDAEDLLINTGALRDEKFTFDPFTPDDDLSLGLYVQPVGGGKFKQFSPRNGGNANPMIAVERCNKYGDAIPDHLLDHPRAKPGALYCPLHGLHPKTGLFTAYGFKNHSHRICKDYDRATGEKKAASRAPGPYEKEPKSKLNFSAKAYLAEFEEMKAKVRTLEKAHALFTANPGTEIMPLTTNPLAPVFAGVAFLETTLSQEHEDQFVALEAKCIVMPMHATDIDASIKRFDNESMTERQLFVKEVENQGGILDATKSILKIFTEPQAHFATNVDEAPAQSFIGMVTTPEAIVAILDSGASDAMAPLHDEFFKDYQMFSKTIGGIGPTMIQATGKGGVQIPTHIGSITIPDVLQVPNMVPGIMLISMGNLAMKNCTFTVQASQIGCYYEGKLQFVAKLQRNRLYYVMNKDGHSFKPVKGIINPFQQAYLPSQFKLEPNPFDRFTALLESLKIDNEKEINCFCYDINFFQNTNSTLECKHHFNPLDFAIFNKNELFKTGYNFLVQTGVYPPLAGTLEEWHLRTNHRSNDVIFKLAAQPQSGIKLTTRSRPPCTFCREFNAKQTTGKGRKRFTRGEYPGEFLHIDNHFNSACLSLSGYTVWVLVIDDYSRMKFIMFLKRMKDFHEEFKTFFIWLENQTGKRVKRLQCDGDRLLFGETKLFIESKGIETTPSLPDTQWQNGVAENAGYILAKDYRANRVTSGLPDNTWDEALRSSVHTANLLPSEGSMEPWNCAYTIFTGRQPDYRTQIAYGSEVVVYLPRKNRPTTGKQESRGLTGVYVGPASGFKGFRLLTSIIRDNQPTFKIVQTPSLYSYNEEPVMLRSRPDYLNTLMKRYTPDSETPPVVKKGTSVDDLPAVPSQPLPAQNIGVSLPFQQRELQQTRDVYTVDTPEIRKKRHAETLNIGENFGPFPTTKDDADSKQIVSSDSIQSEKDEIAFGGAPKNFIQIEGLPPKKKSRKSKKVRFDTTAKEIPTEGGVSSPSSTASKTVGIRKSLRIQDRLTAAANLCLRDSNIIMESPAQQAHFYFAQLIDDDRSQSFISTVDIEKNTKVIHNDRTKDKNSPHFIPAGHHAFQNAMNCASKDEWKEAIFSEGQSIHNNETFLGVNNLPDDTKAISTKWVFAIKYNNKGEIVRHKARLVARGDQQSKDTESYSPTVSLSAIKMILSFSASNNHFIQQFDIETAFLNGKLGANEQVYLKRPDGMSEFTSYKYLLLLKALYGLKQAGRRWTMLFRSTLEKLGLIQSEVEECIFYQESPDGRIILFFWVDDIVVAAPTQEGINHLMGNVLSIFKGKTLGDISLFLGVHYEYDREKGILTSSLEHYITTKIASIEAGRKKVHPRRLPMVSDFLAQCMTHLDSPPVSIKEFANLQGILTWIAQFRLDIAPHTNILAQYSHKPTQALISAQYQIFGYLKAEKALKNYFGTKKDQSLIVFCDSDHASRPIEPVTIDSDGTPRGIETGSRKSRSGGVWFYRGGCVQHLTKQQALPTDSSTYAETVAAHDQLRITLYLRKLATELERPTIHTQTIKFEESCLNLKEFDEIPSIPEFVLPPTPVFIDNMACIRILTAEQTYLKRSKHFEARYMFTKHYVGNAIHIYHIRTDFNLADFFTKPLGWIKFIPMRDKIMKCDFNNASLIEASLLSSDPAVQTKAVPKKVKSAKVARPWQPRVKSTN